MRTNPRTAASRAPDPRIPDTAAPPPWAPTLGEAVAIRPLSGKAGTVEAIWQRVGNATQFSVSYVNGVGTFVEDYFRVDQLAPTF
jgi:hypothetical protein